MELLLYKYLFALFCISLRSWMGSWIGEPWSMHTWWTAKLPSKKSLNIYSPMRYTWEWQFLHSLTSFCKFLPNTWLFCISMEENQFVASEANKLGKLNLSCHYYVQKQLIVKQIIELMHSKILGVIYLSKLRLCNRKNIKEIFQFQIKKMYLFLCSSSFHWRNFA